MFLAVTFSVLTLGLLVSFSALQSRVQSAADARLLADNQRRAAAVADFVTERRQAVLELARSREIESYLVNRALGMSPQYILGATLDVIAQRFRQQILQRSLREQAVYMRIVLLGTDGAILAQAGTDDQAAPVPAIPDNTPQLLTDTRSWRIVATAPVIYKGVFSGTVVTISDLHILSRLLIATGGTTDAAGRYQEYLLTDEGASVPPPAPAAELPEDNARAFARLRENKVFAAETIPGADAFAGQLVLRTSIVGSPFSMLTLTSRATAYGPLTSPAYLLFPAALALAMLLAAFGLERMRKRSKRSPDPGSTFDRGLLQQRTQALAAEMSQRQTTEAELDDKTQQLDKAKADLRVYREQLDLVLQGANDGLWDWDLETDEVYYSPRWKSMLGYGDHELPNTPETFTRLIDPEQVEGVLDRMKDYADGRSGLLDLEFRMRHKDGHWVDISARAVRAGASGTVAAKRLIGTHADVSKRTAPEDEAKFLAFHDPLTRLPNRRLLLDRLREAQAGSVRSGRTGALLVIDLANFKDLNDTLGQDKGDLLLQQVAGRLASCVRKGDTVARLGGDEFVVMLEELSATLQEAANAAEIVGEKILATISQIYRFAGYELHITPSIGATLFSDAKTSVEGLLNEAELAMGRAKAVGRHTLRFFDPAMQVQVSARAAQEIDLRKAIAQEQFRPYYQTQVDADGRVIGAEMLLRWQHPQRGLVMPNEFLPLAEETGLILPLGDWALETACRQLTGWTNRPGMPDLTIAANVSARQIRHPDFVENVLATLKRTGANPERLKLELTESLLLEDVDGIILKMAALKDQGVRFSLDDFGTGYSSLAYLQRLPLDQLKIDGSFVHDDPDDTTVARTIVGLGRSLGLGVIAEGVETETQRQVLASVGCLAYQGYLFSHPLPADGFETSMQAAVL